MKFNPITVIGGSRGVIEVKTPFLRRRKRVFLFYGNPSDDALR
jgi:hypothetical protein